MPTKPTKNTFLWKGVTEHGMVRTFITKNGKLLIHHHGNMRYFNFFNYRQWSKLVGSWENCNMIFGRAAYVRGGDEALKNGGYLQKRLYLQGCFGRSWKYVALISTFIPHIMNDAKNCPIIARQKIRMFDAYCGDLKAVEREIKRDLWLGGVKVPFLPCSRPTGLSFKPQKPNDIYYIRAMLTTETHYAAEANEWLLSNQHRRHEIKGLNKDFANFFVDAFMLKRQMVDAGMQAPRLTIENAARWAGEVHRIWDEKQAEIQLARDAATNAMPLPGENFIPELEEFRVKTRGDLRRAGIECHHCVGSYADRPNMVHYRKGNVVCQVEWNDEEYAWGRRSDNMFEPYVNQCYDFANKTTPASQEFRQEVERYLRNMTPDYVRQFLPSDIEEVIAYHGENVIVRRNHEIVEMAPDRFELDAMPF